MTRMFVCNLFMGSILNKFFLFMVEMAFIENRKGFRQFLR
jgi:hypothetical protein